MATERVVTNLRISQSSEMGPMLATEGESDQIAAHTASQQCVEGAGAGARASNDRKQANEGGVEYRSGPVPHLS
jgi:hypothetical protein